MKKVHILILIALLFASCNTSTKNPTLVEVDKQTLHYIAIANF